MKENILPNLAVLALQEKSLYNRNIKRMNNNNKIKEYPITKDIQACIWQNKM